MKKTTTTPVRGDARFIRSTEVWGLAGCALLVVIAMMIAISQHGGTNCPHAVCLAHDGVTLPDSATWWRKHTPPLHWGCLCALVAVTRTEGLATLTAPNAGCALATIYGASSPLGNGAWSFNAVDGAAIAVPATYGVPPAYCPEPTLSAWF
jgi:hypothetical protein